MSFLGCSGGGNRKRCGVVLQALACWILLGALASAAGPDPNQKGRNEKSKKKQAQEYALLFGTVFDETGRSVRGAEVGVQQKGGKKRWEAATDVRGEFVVHLPAGSAVYIVEASAPGFGRDTREVSFVADERVDVALHLARQAR